MASTRVLDPFTFEVVTKAMLSIVEEAGITLMKASYTPLIKEGFDFSCVILDAQGELVAVASHTPIQMAGVSFATREAIDEFRAEGFEDGDVIIVNDPYRGGNHLPDVSLITPFFHESERLFFFANRAHWEDMGGMVAGSVSVNATDLYGEGLRIPPVKIFRRGQLQPDVLKLIMSNLRVPNEREGDMRAQIAANELGKRRLRALVDKYAVETVRACAEEFKDYSERRVRAEIERLPDGRYEFFDYMDNDGITDDLVKFAATVDVHGSDMTVDLSGSSPQCRGPINSPLANTIAAVMVAVQHFLEDPKIPLTEGTYRPIRVIAPEGSVVNPRFPAPCGSVTGSSRRIIWTVLGALGQAVPARMTGSNFGSMCDIGISGVDPRNGQRFVIYAIVEGGWGARRDRDGMSAMRNLMGQIMNTPAELFEVHEPLFVERVSLRIDSGGPGTFRGGLGVVREYRALTECDVAIALDRCKIGPWGFAGGKSAARMEVEVHRANGEVMSVAAKGGKVSGLRLGVGDGLVILSPGGGGWGSPYQRQVERVERDVRYGYATVERALSDYGVVLDAHTLVAEREATKEIRARLKAQQRDEELYGFDVDLPEIEALNRAAYPRALANGLEAALNGSQGHPNLARRGQQ